MKNILLASCLAAAIAPAATAGLEIGTTVDLMHMDMETQGRSLRFVYDGSLAPDAPKYAGTEAGTKFGIAGLNVFSYCNPVRPGRIKGFCVEVNEGFERGACIEYDVMNYTDVPEENPPGSIGSNANRTALIGDLYARHYAAAFDLSGGFQDWKDRIAGFQLAIWEISHEMLSGDTSQAVGELNLMEGAFQVFDGSINPEAIMYANMFMSTLGDGGLRTVSNLFGLSNPDNQDILVVVPSPAIAGLAGLGLIGLRRRRR